MRTSMLLPVGLLAGCLAEPNTEQLVGEIERSPLPPCWYTDVEVRTADELVSALAAPGRRITIPSNVSIDLSDPMYHELEIPSCTTIVGSRDKLVRGGLLYTNHVAVGYKAFIIRSNHVRIQGVRLRGPINPDLGRSDSLPNTIGIDIRIAPGTAYVGRDIVIENNELLYWPAAAIQVKANVTQSSPEEVPADMPHVGRENVDEVMIRNNYIHHNARNELGYGVVVRDGAYATIERNVFDYNRHAIASDGAPFTGYHARLNYVLDGGYSEETDLGFDYWNQHFDVHGTGTNGYGGTGGEFYDVNNNTFRGAQGYGVYPVTFQRPCITVRATPMDQVTFHDNIALQWSDQCVRRKGDIAPVERVFESNNTYHLDTHDDLGVGDFDGDGNDDVIVTTGTAWYYSSAGRTEWRYLRNSGIRVANLAYADIDNDGFTDVLTRLSDGYINVAYRGTSSWTPLMPSPEPITQLRFGDFDGDGLTDVFRRAATGTWTLWYASEGRWISTRASSLAIDDLRFGEFDGLPGMDVVGTSNGNWAISRRAASSWVAINTALAPLRETRVGDFDGDGLSDLAHQSGGQWRAADGGQGSWQVLRSDGGISLARVQLGDFDGGGETDALQFSFDGRFAAWMGLGNANGGVFVTRSWHTMR